MWKFFRIQTIRDIHYARMAYCTFLLYFYCIWVAQTEKESYLRMYKCVVTVELLALRNLHFASPNSSFSPSRSLSLSLSLSLTHSRCRRVWFADWLDSKYLLRWVWGPCLWQKDHGHWANLARADSSRMHSTFAFQSSLGFLTSAMRERERERERQTERERQKRTKRRKETTREKRGWGEPLASFEDRRAGAPLSMK